MIVLDYDNIKIIFDTNQLTFKLYKNNILIDVKDKLIELFKINDK